MSEFHLLQARPAVPEDAPGIKAILDIYAAKQIVLPRSEDDIRFYIKNFVVVEDHGTCLGCCAARDFGNGLLEIRSLAVQPEAIGKGLGGLMVGAIIERLKAERSSFRLFALTLRADFFLKLGFRMVDKELFPEKIWSDCSKCPKKENCDEVAVLFEYAG